MKNKYILLIFMFLCLQANSQEWKSYPYHPEGSRIGFPGDEGFHPGESTEWWYINGHITGESTGDYYTFMISYFYEPIYIFDGFRIFNLCNETTREFYDETLPCDYESIAEDSLNIIATVGYPTTHYEEWVTQTDSGGTMKPFQYHIAAISENGAIDINCNTVKRPLIIADSGFLYQGRSGYTYYYSQSMMEISGSITFNSTTENISGFGWLDRQFGSFNPNEGEEYEWFCIQLDNGTDLNIWNIFTDDNKIPDTSTYRICSIYINDSSSFTTSEFNIERLEFAFANDSARCYSQKWHLLADTFDIDLVISAQNSDNEVELPFRFFEGSIDINGTMQGAATQGKGFTELLHSYQNPDIDIIYPDSSSKWEGSEKIAWALKNPDEGMALNYDIDISTDNKNTFSRIARVYNDTGYYWNPAYFIEDTIVWLRITGFSADSTLSGDDIRKEVIPATEKYLQLCHGDEYSFLILSDERENFSYQWQIDGENISGATDSLYYIDLLTTEDNGEYRCIVTGNQAADTTVTYTLMVNPVYETYVYDTICISDSIFIGGEWQKTEGVYYDTLNSLYGCDSIRTVSLSIESCGLELRDIHNSDIIIAANAFGGLLYLKFNEYINGCVEIINTRGDVLIIKQAGNTREMLLDVSDLAEGIYIVRITSSKVNMVNKIFLGR